MTSQSKAFIGQTDLGNDQETDKHGHETMARGGHVDCRVVTDFPPSDGRQQDAIAKAIREYLEEQVLVTFEYTIE